MTLRVFETLDSLRGAPFDLPSTLLETAETWEGRGEPWQACHFEKLGREVWTLVALDDRQAVQWRDGERFEGEWRPDRQAVLLEEEAASGLYSLEGRRLPEDPFDDEDEEGGSYEPAFGKKDKLNL